MLRLKTYLRAGQCGTSFALTAGSGILALLIASTEPLFTGTLMGILDFRRSPMSIDDDVRSENRKYCRVEACIPFACRLVPPEEQKKIRSHVSSATFHTGHKTMPEIHDPSLAEWINLVSIKLDTIIQLLTLEREGFSSLPFECVNISGGGLRFLSHNKYTIGDMVEIRMMLSLHHPVALYVYATVLSASERRAEGDYDICVEFMTMDNAIQDEIIRFVFEREREILRVKKGQLT